MVNVFLNINNGFKWFSFENIFVKGYFFDKKNKFYYKSDLLSFFKGVKSIIDFKEKIKEANGVFTVIVKTNDIVYIASDTTRLFPLFYSFRNDDVIISDDILYLKKKLNINETDKQTDKEFLAAAHTIGNKTLFKDIFQIQSNEYITFKRGEIDEKGFFFSYSTNKVNLDSYEHQKKQAVTSIENSFKRLTSSLNDKHVAIPLSGGYDSRLIAVMLKKHNYQNVTCFTYGKKDNAELKNARKTADTLGYEWIFIEYNDELYGDFLKSETFMIYAHYAGKCSSMPFLQDYFAVKYLKEKKIIPNDSIFIPGHSGDFLGGSQLVKVIKANIQTEKLSSVLFKKKFFNVKMPFFDSIVTKKSIQNNLYEYDNDFSKKIPYSVAEDYDIKEKLAKFLFNSSSVYSFFGYEHRFPFWDKELLLFFKNVPYKYKKMKLLYDEVLKTEYFKRYNLNFNKELQPKLKSLIIQKVKNKIKQILPGFLRRKILLKNNQLNRVFTTNQMEQSFKNNKIKYKKAKNSYNEIIIQWYLSFVKGKIKQ